jgi:uncharacterized pyridoxal phosphate-containing UPF0001 family protein
MKMNKNVFKTTDGVKISFTGAIQKEKVLKMVENCATNSCDCMSPATKAKISDMQVSGEDGNIELNLRGEISKVEIEKALANSPVLNAK